MAGPKQGKEAGFFFFQGVELWVWGRIGVEKGFDEVHEGLRWDLVCRG